MVRRYKKKWRYDNDSKGLRRRVPSDATLAHLERCKAAGMDNVQIARIAGLPTATIWRLLQHQHRTLRTGTERAILSVTVDTFAGANPGTLVPRIGARRRLQALMCMGYSI